MKYQPVEFDDSVNVTRGNPLVDFITYITGAAVFIALIYFISAFFVDWAVEHTSPRMERWLGQKMATNTSLLTESTLTPELLARQENMRELFARLPKDESQQGTEIYLIDKKEINAYALPGRKIIIYTGLLNLLKSENALVFVMGHELGHIKHRDHLRGMGRGLVAGVFSLMLFGEDSSIPKWVSKEVMTIGNSFTREQERAADREGLDMLVQYYGHVGGATEFFEKIANSSGAVWMSYLETHPHPKQRMRITQNIILEKNYHEQAVVPLGF